MEPRIKGISADSIGAGSIRIPPNGRLGKPAFVVVSTLTDASCGTLALRAAVV
jgi:hypothetical protein